MTDSLRVAVPLETAEAERRVALVPDGVARLRAAGLQVVLQAGAGLAAGHPDRAYEEQGAEIVADAAAVFGGANVVLKVQPPNPAEVELMTEGAVVLSFLQPNGAQELIGRMRDRGITAFSLDLLPRISRAQGMDALSSQALISGYRAVVLAASRMGKMFPLMMTAAGTIAPARVLVIGAGVAGLQAIATARRLGAVVEAYDVRAAAKEEVKSLGATFVELPLESQEGEGGYAREQTEEYQRRQRELLAERVAAADLVVTTAAIPGRRAPLLVTREMVERMRPGSMIVDLAAETGGNCELSRPGEDVLHGGVTIHGALNFPSQMAPHASMLLSKNLTSLLMLLVKDGALVIDLEDEIVRGSCVTHGGQVVAERARQALESAGVTPA